MRQYNADSSRSSSRHNEERDEEEREEVRLTKLPYGCGLADYEVPFSYTEQGIKHTELVKLRLCLRCSPMLFYGRGGAIGAKRARDTFHDTQNGKSPAISKGCAEESTMNHEPVRRKLKSCDDSISSATSQSSNSTASNSRRQRKRKRKKESRRKRSKKDASRDHRKDHRQKKKSRRARERSSSPDSSTEQRKRGSTSTSNNRQDAASINFASDDSEGMRAEVELLSNIETCQR